MEVVTVPCTVCFRSPTLTVPIRRNVGMLLMRRTYRLEQPLCRDHGLEATKSFLGRTAIQGWWGTISLFYNVYCVATDVSALVKFSRLSPPSA